MKRSIKFLSLALSALISLPFQSQAAITKASVVVSNDITMTAGAGDATSADTSLTGVYRAICHIRFTNGATGPTIAPRVDVQTAEDTTAAHYSKIVTVTGGVANNGVTVFDVELNDAVEHVRFISGSNTGQNVTLRVVIEEITAI